MAKKYVYKVPVGLRAGWVREALEAVEASASPAELEGAMKKVVERAYHRHPDLGDETSMGRAIEEAMHTYRVRPGDFVRKTGEGTEKDGTLEKEQAELLERRAEEDRMLREALTERHLREAAEHEARNAGPDEGELREGFGEEVIEHTRHPGRR